MSGFIALPYINILYSNWRFLRNKSANVEIEVHDRWRKRYFGFVQTIMMKVGHNADVSR